MRRSVIAAVVLIALSGCGGGDDVSEVGPERASSDDEEAFVDDWSETLAADGRLSPDQSRCIARRMVDEIGVERLEALTNQEPTDADPRVQQEVAGAVIGAAEACDVPLASLGG